MERGDVGLKRELDTRRTTLFTAAMIVGTGIFAAFGAATNAAGSGILVAMILGGSVALATGISAAQLGVNYPEEGGAFTWARALEHDTGFIAGCGYIGSQAVSDLPICGPLSQVVPWDRGLPGAACLAAQVIGKKEALGMRPGLIDR